MPVFRGQRYHFFYVSFFLSNIFLFAKPKVATLAFHKDVTKCPEGELRTQIATMLAECAQNGFMKQKDTGKSFQELQRLKDHVLEDTFSRMKGGGTG